MTVTRLTVRSFNFLFHPLLLSVLQDPCLSSTRLPAFLLTPVFFLCEQLFFPFLFLSSAKLRTLFYPPPSRSLSPGKEINCFLGAERPLHGVFSIRQTILISVAVLSVRRCCKLLATLVQRSGGSPAYQLVTQQLTCHQKYLERFSPFENITRQRTSALELPKRCRRCTIAIYYGQLTEQRPQFWNNEVLDASSSPCANCLPGKQEKTCVRALGSVAVRMLRWSKARVRAMKRSVGPASRRRKKRSSQWPKNVDTMSDLCVRVLQGVRRDPENVVVGLAIQNRQYDRKRRRPLT